MSVKGWPGQEKLDRIKNEFPTVEPVRNQQFALSVLSHLFTYLVGTDAAEAGSTASQIVATAHAAVRGDILVFTSGTFSGREIKVISVTANLIVLAEDLSAAVGAGDTFQILRHKYPIINSDGSIPVSATFSEQAVAADGGALPAVVKVVGGYDGANVQVVHTDASGDLQIDVLTSALPTGAATSANQTNKAQYTHLTDGTDDVLVTAAGELNVLSAAQPGVDIGDVTVNNAAGASAVNIQDGGNSITIDGSVTAIAQPGVDIGDVTINNAAGASAVNIQDGGNSITVDGSVTVSATDLDIRDLSHTQDSVRIGDGTDLALVTAAGELNVLASAQPGVDIGDVTINNAGGGAAVNIQDGGNSITVDGSVTASFPSVTLTEMVRNDYSSVNVTTAAYVQLVASTANTYEEVEIFDSSGQTLKLAIGAAASEVDKFLIFPGGNGRIRYRIPSGSRVSIRAVSATASAGEIDVNFYG